MVYIYVYIDHMETKHCSKCKKEKPVSDFRKRNGRNGFIPWCKSCEYYYQHHEAPGRFWTRLAYNINRHHPGARLTTAQLKTIDKEGICYICGDSLLGETVELDHIIPLSQGGKTEIGNLRWTHRQCNRLKHDMTIEEMKEKMKKILSNLN